MTGRIGLVGGTGWVSTAVYYRLLNEQVQRELGGLHGADLMLRSLDLQHLIDHLSEPSKITAALDLAVDELGLAGARVIGYASVTAHRFASPGSATVHIADAVAPRLADLGAHRIGVLATSLSRGDPALIRRLAGPGQPIFPSDQDQDRLDRIIFDELMPARIDHATAAELTKIIDRLRSKSDLILLACTELSFAAERYGPWPGCHDVTEWHCAELINRALSGQSHPPRPNGLEPGGPHR